VLGFARLLRRAGLSLGPDRVLDGVRTAAAVGLRDRADFYWALHAVFVSRPEDRALFRQAFELFWRERGGRDDALAALLPRVDRSQAPGRRRASSRRVAEAFSRPSPLRPRPDPGEPTGLAMHAIASDRETLRSRDFAEMSADEVRRARALIAALRLPLADRPTRRFRTRGRGRRVDVRASLRASLRGGGADLPILYREPIARPPPLVVLCDISGSMSPYARMLLHFCHALVSGRKRVHVFVFGTRLSNVTRTLRERDVDAALASLGREVPDWSGGTRIGEALREFNRRWSRRLLAQGATVLLLSDGLDCGSSQQLGFEADRLHRSCRRLIWLNPLLRYPAFEPRAEGIRALLPHVDAFRPAHDLRSLEDLAAALASRGNASPLIGRAGSTRRA
jgi:hypothetical protein